MYEYDLDDEKKTPEEWLNTEFSYLEILDPDGWDRKNFEEDWKRPLTVAEFQQKVMASTVIVKN